MLLFPVTIICEVIYIYIYIYIFSDITEIFILHLRDTLLFSNTDEVILSRKYSDYSYAINLPQMRQIEMQSREEDKTFSLFYRSVEKHSA